MTYPHILLTRTQPGASLLAVKLMDKGFNVSMTPAMGVSATHKPAPSAIFDIPAILLTSPNGLRFARLPQQLDRSIPLYAVGESTAQFAREAGWTNVTAGTGDILGMEKILKQNFPAGTKFVHIRGVHVSPDTEGALADFEITPWVTYETYPDSYNLASIPKFLSRPGKHIIVLQSARAAELLREHVKTHAARINAGEISVLCLSAAVLKSLEPWGNKGFYCCQAPSEDAVLHSLHGISQNMME